MFGFLRRMLGGDAEGAGAVEGAETAPGEAVAYNGFTIIPEPYKAKGQWQLAARIVKDVDGATKEHRLVRADLVADPQEARDHALMKAKRVIDEQGDGLFG